jgi:hypothetical protein
MSQSEIDTLKRVMQVYWPGAPEDKTKKYVNQFFNRTRLGTKITAQVIGNHGTYTVSVGVDGQKVMSTCSCYIGKHGCHHTAALAKTFLNDPASFQELKTRPLDALQALAELPEYLRGITLEKLLQELKVQGITQKAFAESIGMSTQHLSAVKSAELRNRTYHELGATKLACLWVLERFGKKGSGG